ncbi:MAG: glycosyltransferase family 2 protein [Clostridium sp.]|uniref:glycosyltransferase family 2 protein n=1 Tax=Clostridium sp. TaxID=1506 RepID=UPI0039ED33A9
MENKTLYLVIPCYNEESVLRETAKQLNEKMKTMILKNYISKNSKIMFVNDGSKDSTWNIIEDLNRNDPIFIGLKLSRNKGHQNALLAGLMDSKNCADMVISLDADLQDDINVIDSFVEEYYAGSDIVYGVRSKREKDTFFKRFTAESFYKFMKALGVDIVFNHADYRLMSKRALEALEQFKEVNLFLRGIIPLIGFKSSIVVYERNERFAGESKYPLKKMLNFAFEGITSFSVKPIRIITTIGGIIFIISTLFFIYSLIMKFLGKTVVGWTSIVCSIWMIGGIQLLCLGVIGEYIGKIYNEVKARPKYIIEKRLSDNISSNNEKQKSTI